MVEAPTCRGSGAPDVVDVALGGAVVDSSAAYDGHGVANALDGDPDDDYVAAIERPLPHFFTIDLRWSVPVAAIETARESRQPAVGFGDVGLAQAGGASGSGRSKRSMRTVAG